MDQPGKVANPTRGQLNKGNEYFSVLDRASEFGLARRVQPSHPASACSFPILRLNLVVVLTHGIRPDSRAASIYLFKPPCTIGPVPSYRVTHLRNDGVHYRESAGTGPVVLKVIPATGAAFASPWTK